MDIAALAEQALPADGSYVVHLAKKNVTVKVGAGDNMLDCLLDAGANIPFACHDGICGTCLTPVLGGRPEHWDSFQTPDEQDSNQTVTPCCSKSLTAALILDV